MCLGYGVCTWSDYLPRIRSPEGFKISRVYVRDAGYVEIQERAWSKGLVVKVMDEVRTKTTTEAYVGDEITWA